LPRGAPPCYIAPLLRRERRRMITKRTDKPSGIGCPPGRAAGPVDGRSGRPPDFYRAGRAIGSLPDAGVR
jgi:hypothetical protein